MIQMRHKFYIKTKCTSFEFRMSICLYDIPTAWERIMTFISFPRPLALSEMLAEMKTDYSGYIFRIYNRYATITSN